MASNEPPRFILFLPPLPSPPTLSSLKTAFGDTVSQVLKEVASHSSDSPKAAVLEIALSCPGLAPYNRRPRSTLYSVAQTSLAGVYKLVCAIAAQDGIDVEDANGVDVRVLLIASDQPRQPYGPVVDLQTLAHSGRQWQYAFGVETEEGEAMVRAFVAAKSSGKSASVTAADRDLNTASRQQLDAKSSGRARQHHHVAVGGTFDHLHIGHKLLLTMTVFAVDDPSESQDVERSATIGITGDRLLVKKKHAEVLESWDMRQQAVQTFLDSLLNFTSQAPKTIRHSNPGPNGLSVDLQYPHGLVVKCTEIQDPFGPTITEECISALVISAETRAGGKAVNEKRAEKGWGELEVFEVDVLGAGEDAEVMGDGFEGKLSSTAIRQKIARQTGSAVL